jgi:hypothetical protein
MRTPVSTMTWQARHPPMRQSTFSAAIRVSNAPSDHHTAERSPAAMASTISFIAYCTAIAQPAAASTRTTAARKPAGRVLT